MEKKLTTNKQIGWGTMLSYVSIAITVLSGILYTPWMINQIGKSQYGLYTLVNSLISIFLVDFGLSSATSRYLSKYSVEGDKEGAECFLGAIYKLYLIIDAVILSIFIVIFFLLERMFVNMTPVEIEQLKVVYVICAIFSVVNFPFVTFNGILISYEKFIPLKLTDIIYRVLNVVLTVIALILGYGLYALVSVQVIVGLVVILIKFIIIKKEVPLKPNFRLTDRSLYKEIFSFSIWVTIATFAGRLVFNITPSIIGIVATSADIAVFGVVSTFESYTYILTTAMSGMFIKKLSELLAKKDYKNELESLFTRVGIIQYAINGLIVVGFAALGKQFIDLWVGNGFSNAYIGILLVLVPGMFYNALMIAEASFVVLKKVHIQAFLSIATGLVNVVLSFPFTKMWGSVGACASIFVAFCVKAVIMNVACRTELKVNLGAFIKKCYLRLSIPMIISILCGMGANIIIPGNNWLTFVVKAGIVALIYLVTVLFVGLGKKDREYFIEKLKGMIKSSSDVKER